MDVMWCSGAPDAGSREFVRMGLLLGRLFLRDGHWMEAGEVESGSIVGGFW